jgi:hypothetical protein
MEALDYWRLCDEFTVIQAALLIIGEDPAGTQEYVDGWNPTDRPTGYDAAKAALCHAISSKKLTASIRLEQLQSWDTIAECMVDYEGDEPDWKKTTISLDELKQWLRSRGISSGFFFPEKSDQPDYLDTAHSRYAPKLAAAVNAWLAMENTDTTKGKSPKQALSKWLREHAAEFKLSDDEGKPNETGIEECAKVSNWQDKGGAPKTPLS